MNGTFRYRLGMAWRLWRTVPEVTLWAAFKMLRYVPVPQSVLDETAKMAPAIAFEEAAKIAEGFANCGCGRDDCYSDNIPKAIAEAIRAKAKI